MYKLYYYPGNANMAPHFVLEELAVDFELVLVDRKSSAQKSAEYLALNPAGRIPTLVHEDFVLFESSAICLYLCEQHPSANLMPDLGSQKRALFYQWLMYLTNTLQAEMMVYFYPDKHTTNAADALNIKMAQEARITDIFSLLDGELSNKEFLVGPKITACDYFLLMLTMWAEGFAKPPMAFANLGRYLQKLTKRQAVINVCRSEGLSLDGYR